MDLIIKTQDAKENLNILKNQIFNGDVDALEVYATLKPLMDNLDKFNKSIKDYVMDEVYKHGNNTIAYGFEVGIRNGGETLNYIDDPVYKELHDKLKSREALLKTALKSNECIFDSEGLEVPKVSTKQRANSIVLTKQKTI